MYFVVDRISEFGKKQLLGSAVVVNAVGALVENIVCTVLETVVFAAVGFVLKDFVSPWTILDILGVDIGLTVVYILWWMPRLRKSFHENFKHPCRVVGRKILGLDIKNRIAFLKIKWIVVVIGSSFVLYFISVVEDPRNFVRLTVFETVAIQGCVDAARLWGDETKKFVHDYYEGKTAGRKLSKSEAQKIMHHYESPPGTPLDAPNAPRPGKNTIFGEIHMDHFSVQDPLSKPPKPKKQQPTTKDALDDIFL